MAERVIRPALGDLDGDGDLDLLLLGYDQGCVFVLLGAGDGTFGEARAFPLPERPLAVALLDWTGDGHLDALVGHHHDSELITILSGKGDGTFRDHQPLPLRKAGGNELHTYDLDGDGREDLLATVGDFGGVPSRDGDFARPPAPGVLGLVADGRGGGALRPNVLGTAAPRHLRVADMDGDGRDDLIALEDGNYARPAVTVFRRDGAEWVAGEPARVGRWPVALATGDLDGDGRRDVVTANLRDHELSVLLGDERRGLRAARAVRTGKDPSDVALVDADRDGDLDALVTSGEDALLVYRGRGDGTFERAQRVGDERVESVLVADLDRDGVQDFLVLGRYSGTVSVHLVR